MTELRDSVLMLVTDVIVAMSVVFQLPPSLRQFCGSHVNLESPYFTPEVVSAVTT